MLGLWIDALTDEERDRIIEAQNWESGNPCYGNNCLVGHAKECATTPEMIRALDIGYFDSPMLRFDLLVGRFGLDRVVRAIKARAAKGNRIELPGDTAEVAA